MPFGAEPTADGAVRFRLWAPGAERVALDLVGAEPPQHLLDMEAVGDGWFERVTDLAAPGSRYRFRITGAHVEAGQAVPDPASRFQPDGVHGPSEVINPAAFRWPEDETGAGWPGRPWETAVCYELHVGAFSRDGTFASARRRLPDLAGLGITAVELMPVAAFPGARGWGYDGVFQFAPFAGYGRPEDLKALVLEAHRLGLMVFLDVVYNHFGPEGNYLHLYAPQFFTEHHHTPWGAGINVDGPHSRTVREFFVHNALFWLEEYQLDGLRLDAVHAISDDGEPHILTELAEAVHAGPGRERLVHLVLENDANEARHLERDPHGKPRWYTAQWNDDAHHAAHVLLTGETDGYYVDYAGQPLAWLARALAQGFGYQGERSSFREGTARGEPSAHLPPPAFVNFLQTHDQVGNRAFGERLHQLTSPEALRAATAALLLAPPPPLLFMGQEVAADSPFLFFCDFGADLAEAVTAGRRRELASFAPFADKAALSSIPDPNDPGTFTRSRLDWSALDTPEHGAWHEFHRHLLALRHAEIVPRLAGIGGHAAGFDLLGGDAGRDPEAGAGGGTAGHTGLAVRWRLGDGSLLTLVANLGEADLPAPGLHEGLTGRLLHQEPAGAATAIADGRLPAWAAAWYLEAGASADIGFCAADPHGS
jgi:malto-oligosyltrehalose trehalohydrolase